MQCACRAIQHHQIDRRNALENTHRDTTIGRCSRCMTSYPCRSDTSRTCWCLRHSSVHCHSRFSAGTVGERSHSCRRSDAPLAAGRRPVPTETPRPWRLQCPVSLTAASFVIFLCLPKIFLCKYGFTVCQFVYLSINIISYKIALFRWALSNSFQQSSPQQRVWKVL